VDLDVLVVDLLQPTLLLSMIAVAVGLGLGLPALVLAWGVSCTAAAATAFVTYRRMLAAMPAPEPVRYATRNLMRVSLPILFVGFSYILMGHVDKLMLAHFADAAAVGTYAAAFRLSRQMGVVQGAMAPVLAPLVSALDHRRNHDDLERVYHLVTRWTMLITLPILAVTLVWGDALLGLFGDAFRGAWILLAVLIAGQAANVGGGVAMQFLQMTGEQDRDLRILVIGLVGNVVLNVVLIGRFGAIGAATATAIAFTGISLSRIVAVKRKYGLWPISRSCAKPVLASVAMAGVGVSLRSVLPSGSVAFWVALVGMSAAYVGVLKALGLPEEDRGLLRLVRPGRKGGAS
jgi:O-antigen/teichoic acid export membrane protein